MAQKAVNWQGGRSHCLQLGLDQLGCFLVFCFSELVKTGTGLPWFVGGMELWVGLVERVELLVVDHLASLLNQTEGTVKSRTFTAPNELC